MSNHYQCSNSVLTGKPETYLSVGEDIEPDSLLVPTETPGIEPINIAAAVIKFIFIIPLILMGAGLLFVASYFHVVLVSIPGIFLLLLAFWVSMAKSYGAIAASLLSAVVSMIVVWTMVTTVLGALISSR